DLLVRELRRLRLRLGALHGQGHAARAQLVVDGGGTDTDEVRALIRACGVQSVAVGAVGGEELLALINGCLVNDRRVGCRSGRRRECVGTTRGDETDGDECHGREWAATPLGPLSRCRVWLRRRSAHRRESRFLFEYVD